MKNAVFIQALAEAFLAEIVPEQQPMHLAELVAFQEAWRHLPTLRDQLAGGGSLQERQEALRTLTKGSLAPQTQHLLLVLMQQHALAQLSALLEQIQRLRVDRKLGKDVTVTTATALDEQERKQLHSQLEARFDMPIALSESVEPAIIGGMRLTSGDWNWDATVRTRLDRLIQHLRQT